MLQHDVRNIWLSSLNSLDNKFNSLLDLLNVS